MATFRWNSDFLKKVQNLDGAHNFPVGELFHPGFMRSNTGYSSFDEMVSASGVEVEKIGDIDGNEAWSEFVKANSRFASWDDMKRTAILNWTKNQLK